MINWLKARVRSLGYAFQGFKVFFTMEVHARVHTVAGCVAILFGFLFDVSKQEWLWLFSAIALVLSAEIFNSSIEVLVDMVSPEKTEAAGKAKDMAAAAVVIAAIYASLVGMWGFWKAYVSDFSFDNNSIDALLITVPGPNTAVTPALYKN